jgi:HPt (histidine-containing phosphotransfer) domain-containing protein
MNSCLTKPIRRQILVEAIASMHETQPRQDSEDETTMKENTETVPVIDHSVLIELENATNAALVNRVLDKYLEEAASRLRDARVAAENGDLASLQKMAHSLSGSSSTVGASRLQDLVMNIERHCIEGDGETALALAKELDSIGAQTCQAYAGLAKGRAA